MNEPDRKEFFEIRIPARPRPDWMDRFLDEHPEMREQMDLALERMQEMRHLGEFVIREIYKHFTTGAPFRWGLIITLRTLTRILDEEETSLTELRGVQGPPSEHLEELRSALVVAGRRAERETITRRLFDLVDGLRGDVRDAEARLIVAEHRISYEAAKARAVALREAAELIPTEGFSVDELKRLADAADPRTIPLDVAIADLGIDPFAQLGDEE